MHRSCYLRTEWFIKNYESYLFELCKADKVINVLDVGGKNWNGQVDFFDNNKYKCDVLDIQDGNNVTIIPSDPYKWKEISNETYDLCLSLNAFQHIDYFWETAREMARVTKRGGLIFIIAPSMRYDGNYPYANWAFNSHGLVALANWARLEVIDHSVAGIPNEEASEEWDSHLDDAMLIARKPGGVVKDYQWAQLSVMRRFGM